MDDIVVEATDSTGATVMLEIQAKRTLDFTASDPAFASVVRQITSASGEAAERPIAAAIARTSAKIERHYHQLLILARKTTSAAAMRRALDAPRVVSAGMRDFATSFVSHLRAAGSDCEDETLWKTLRRFQILVFDFVSPGAVSNLLALTLAQLALPATERHRASNLWSALQEKALSYDADGGEVDRIELTRWLRDRGFELASSRNIVVARRRLADHSRAALDAIEDQIASVTLDRSERTDQLAAALEGRRYLEIVGASGVGKSALLKAMVAELACEAVPLVLSPARTPPGGWLSLSRDLNFAASAQEFLSELAASGATILFIDSLDRIFDSGVQATVTDLLTAAARTPGVQVVVTVGPDFDDDQREWLPAVALDLLGRVRASVGPLNDAEAVSLAQADPRLAQLIANADARPLTRNLYHLRQLLRRAGVEALPLTEAALARTWWETGPAAQRIQRRDRVRALRHLAAQGLDRQALLDISGVGSSVVEDMVRSDELDELLPGATAVFKQDVLRDWAGANLLREEPARVDNLPLTDLAPVGLARSVELYARMLIEKDASAEAWKGLVARLRVEGAHPSWLRLALLALVRSEQGVIALDRTFEALQANGGELLQSLIRQTIAADSQPAMELLAAAGLPRELIPEGVRAPIGLSWARLMAWLLRHVEQLQVPVGRDILHFVSAWLMGTGGRDPYRPLVAQLLYGWLMELEVRVPKDAPQSNLRLLFAYNGRRGRSRELVSEVRALFLACCDQSPDLAEAYIKAHTTSNERYDVVGDILRFSRASAKAAPAALAAFVTHALIESEKAHRDEFDDPDRGRLQYHAEGWTTPGPSLGPFLEILRSDAAVGIGLIRRIVEYGLCLDDLDQEEMGGFTLDLPTGPFRVLAPGTYLVSRDMGGALVVTSALRALEAWAHEQVDAGRLVGEVISRVLGEAEAPAAVLAVVIDALLSHTTGPDPLLIPFVTSPEALSLDWDRFTRDRVGLNRLEGADPPTVPGSVTNASLWERPSRGTALSWVVGEFLASDSGTLEGVREALNRGLARLAQDLELPDMVARGPRWHAERALRMLDPANWRSVLMQQLEGEPVSCLQYVEPAEEAALLDPLRAEADAALAETALTASLVEAVETPERRTPELRDRGVDWAQTQTWDALRESDKDFDQSQRWRAVVAAAVLAVLIPEGSEAQAWARKVLQRALDVEGSSRNYHVRYDALALATIGWTALARSGDAAARTHLLSLAARDSQTVTIALGRGFDNLGTADPRLPKALLRIGLTAALQPERDREDDTITARRRAKRNRRLRAAVKAEAAWLDGGLEPRWPLLPPARRFAKVRRSIGGKHFDDELDDEAIKSDLWFNEQSGGRWLEIVDGAPVARESEWVVGLIEAYNEFSNVAWGLGLPRDAELREQPKPWLHPFSRLRLRVAARLDAASFETAVLKPLVELPDCSFLEASGEVVRALDSLFWDEKRIPIERLVAARQRIVMRLLECDLWRWRREEHSDSIAWDLVNTIQAVFFHVRGPFGVGRCYMPPQGTAFADAFHALVTLTRDAPGSSYVASYFISLAERAQAWVPLDHIVCAAEGWADARADDAVFWRDEGYGRRLCALLDAQTERLVPADPELVQRVRRLLEHLISAGVPEASPIQLRLSSLANL